MVEHEVNMEKKTSHVCKENNELMLQQIASKKEIQLDLLVHLHDAKSFEVSHYFQNSINS